MSGSADQQLGPCLCKDDVYTLTTWLMGRDRGVLELKLFTAKAYDPTYGALQSG